MLPGVEVRVGGNYLAEREHPVCGGLDFPGLQQRPNDPGSFFHDPCFFFRGAVPQQAADQGQLFLHQHAEVQGVAGTALLANGDHASARLIGIEIPLQVRTRHGVQDDVSTAKVLHPAGQTLLRDS